MRHHSTFAELKAGPDGLQLFSSYNPDLVVALKSAIPASERRFDGNSKAWIVNPKHGQTVARLCREHLGITVDVPQAQIAPKAITRMIQLEYLGQAKDRGDGSQSAFGWIDNGWKVIFPLSVLQSWFCVDPRPGEALTLYGVLGLQRTANPDEIKAAYRRLARQWHPDVCKEPDASQQFQTIKAAYDVLSNPNQKARYEAGLRLTGNLEKDTGRNFQQAGWRCPLRAGWLLVESVQSVGRLVVNRILKWEDITNAQGQTYVPYWPAGAKEFAVRWQ